MFKIKWGDKKKKKSLYKRKIYIRNSTELKYFSRLADTIQYIRNCAKNSLPNWEKNITDSEWVLRTQMKQTHKWLYKSTYNKSPFYILA